MLAPATACEINGERLAAWSLRASGIQLNLPAKARVLGPDDTMHAASDASRALIAGLGELLLSARLTDYHVRFKAEI